MVMCYTLVGMGGGGLERSVGNPASKLLLNFSRCSMICWRQGAFVVLKVPRSHDEGARSHDESAGHMMKVPGHIRCQVT